MVNQASCVKKSTPIVLSNRNALLTAFMLSLQRLLELLG